MEIGNPVNKPVNRYKSKVLEHTNDSLLNHIELNIFFTVSNKTWANFTFLHFINLINL